MKRRMFLAGACTGLAAASGCLEFNTSTPFVTNRDITILDRGCGEEENAATLNYDESATQLHLEGVLSGTTACGALDITYAYNEESNRVIVDVLATDTEECESCTRYYEYDATVSFREPPDIIAVFHSDPKLLGESGWTIILDDTASSESQSRQPSSG